MKQFGKIKRDELSTLSFNEYFDYFENSLNKNIDLEQLTELFTEIPYQEKKPYLTRRLLSPKDERFKEIEIVYDINNSNKVKAIVWSFKITLRELVNIFGKPIQRYESYSDSLIFLFSSKNPDIIMVKTRLSQSSNEMIDLKGLELANAKEVSNHILDFEFAFLQFDLKD
jgi:hypothetical protein